ncbi:MAG TPA: tetratricopeptide repeat protein [Candidatus Acidoferrales bacterium]|nr:tetratricopeptide repeat protein [Candidatus Acidoferrales bacterium]
MATSDRFSRLEFQRMLDVTEKQLNYWEKLRLVAPRKSGVEKSYDFRDLITLRTAKQLIEKGVPAQRLQRSIIALQQKLAEVQSPLTELRIRSNGRDVIVERAGVQLEPISGQIMLNFETRELTEKVRMMPQRSANDWVALGVKREEQSASDAGPRLAAEAYRSALETDRGNVDALNNLGTLSYEEGNLGDAIALFRHAVELHADHMLSHFNLGSALEELGHDEQARRHLRRAVQLNPEHADAQYNLAFVCDKLGAYVEARRHWQKYLELDPDSSWSAYARQRLAYEK